MKLIAIILLMGGIMQGNTEMDSDIIKFDKDCKLRVEFINEIGIKQVYEGVMCLSETGGMYIVTNRDGEMGRHTKANNTKMAYEVKND